MNDFERELRKIAGNDAVCDDTRFIGRACYGRLSENNRVKIEFCQNMCQSEYEGVDVTILDKNDGVIDSLKIRFVDVWGKRTANHFLRDGSVAYLRYSEGNVYWNHYKPDPADFEKVTEQIGNYTDLFTTLDQTMSGHRQSM